MNTKSAPASQSPNSLPYSSTINTMNMRNPARTWTGNPSSRNIDAILGGLLADRLRRRFAERTVCTAEGSPRLVHRDLRLCLRSQAPPPPDGVQRSPRREGRQPRRDDERVEAAGAPGVHDFDRCLPRLHGGRLAEGARRRDRQAGHQAREADEAHARRRRRSAARVGSLGRQVLDAGHDGHGPQPRPQRQEREGPGQVDRRRALRLRQLPPVHRDVRAHRARRRR